MKRQTAFGFPQAALWIVCLTLSGCAAGNTAAKFSASHNSFKLALPALTPPAPAAVVLPRACSPDLRAGDPGEPILPLDAFYPAPESATAQAPADRYNAYLHTLGLYIKNLKRLVALGQEACQ
ncbi:MAG: hypothetical protein ACYDD1_13750 [Caulobacteraceae bacterium]